MPRIHEGKKKRGIFSLSTPFQSDGFTFDEDNDPASARGAAAHSDNDVEKQQQQLATANNNNIMGPSHVAPRKENMDIQVAFDQGGMSQLTLEGGTQYYSGTVDEDIRKECDRLDDGGIGESCDQNKNGGDDAKKNEKMNDGLEDDSVTTIGENANNNDEEVSIDLLQEDSPNESKPKSLQDDLAAARNGCTPSSKNKLFTRPPELSPATMTLDRLDAFGSQQGGAELSLNLLNCSTSKNDSMADDSRVLASPEKSGAAKADGAVETMDHDSPEKTVVGTQVETRRDAHGGVPFRLPSEAAERKSAVDGKELLAITRGYSMQSEEKVQAESSTDVQRVKQSIDQRFVPPRQLVARPSKQGLGVEEGDKKYLQGGLNTSKTSHRSNDSSAPDVSCAASRKSSKDSESYTNIVQSISADLAKRQCLHELKEYFMSTQNSSVYARKHQHSDDHPAPPQVPFCIACKNPATQLPHHGLCPKHADFFNSGSYEILNLLVDGNILKCEACSFHFDNGRPNKRLTHISGCEKGKKKNGSVKCGSNSGMKGSSNEVLPDVSLKDAAASGCKKCHQELSSGLKISMPHGTSCPRGPGDLVTLSAPSDPKQSLQNNKVKASLEEAAASGCKKCQNELATGVKTRISHANGCLRSQNPCKECQNEVTTGVKTREPHGNECPRNHNPQRNYHTVSLKDAAASGCKKCQRELVSRKKTAYSHDDGCPRKSKPRVGDKTKMPTNEEEVIKATVSLKDAAVACKKCQRELATGLTSSFQHSAGCPLKAGSTSPSSSNKSDKSPRFHVGTLVFVKSRTWPGVNKLGGVARVTKVHVPSSALDCVKYDVAYVIETRREKSIEEKFVSLHTDYVSPSKDMSLVHRADELDFSASDNEQSDQEKNKLPSSNNVSPAKKKRTVSDTENNDAGELIVLSSAEKKDADGNPLSDYELLRLRNIKRNEARLLKLGLAGPSKDTAKSKERHKSKSSKKEKATSNAEKRSVPHRPTKHDRIEAAANPKANIKTSATVGPPSTRKNQKETAPPSKRLKSTNNDGSNEPPKEASDSLLQGAKSGCQKCTLQWQTDNKDVHSYHDKCCPWYDSSINAVERTPPPSHPTKEMPMSAAAAAVNAANSTRSITPSPALATPQLLPPHIAEFLSEAVDDDILPTLRGAKWLPCPNPWGKVEHEEGDIVVVSPFQSESAHDLVSTYHQGSGGGLPKRFAFKPMSQTSPYLKSHRSPDRGGYTVLRVTRDRAALTPWGFTVKHHEFGGACLVDSVRPLSPADSARDISGWEGSNSSCKLEQLDMIISVNGKSVGGMTEAEFQIELDLCGPEVLLVVSKFASERFYLQSDGNRQHFLGDIAMDWNDIGAITPSDKKVSFSNDKVPSNSFPENHEDNGLDYKQKTPHTNFSVQKNMNDQLDRLAQQCPAVNTRVPRKTSLVSSIGQKKKASSASTIAAKPLNVSVTNGIKSSSNSHGASKTVPSAASSAIKKSRASGTKESSALRKYRQQIEEQSDVSEDEFTFFSGPRNKLAKSNKDVCKDTQMESQDASMDAEAEFDSEDDDENPWLGCVCGKTHPAPIPVFWLQCETCDAWHNVSPECVGFDEAAAEDVGAWSCWSCNPPIAGLEQS